MTYFMGIDGGGSNLRVVITDHTCKVMTQVQHHDSVNPGVVGHQQAAECIQTAMEQTLQEAGLSPRQIRAAGIGVAGASVRHSEKWLRDITNAVLPGAYIAPGSDVEIALVGAIGKREGVIVLAGTGSVAFGVNEFGDAKQVGGWGYLLGDEGSGYWIGLEALKAAARADDGRGELTAITPKILSKFSLQHEGDLIAWVYEPEKPPVREIAQIAPLVMECAEAGDLVAIRIIEMAAAGLLFLCDVLRGELGMKTPPIAFAGGLLESDNLLSKTLCQLLEIPTRPQPKYPPVVGAALLAQIHIKAQDAN